MTRPVHAVPTTLAALAALALGAALPARAQPVLVALAPGATDDARRAVALGPAGEVYEPDGKGAWVRRQRFTTAKPLSAAARAGGAVVALGDGVIFRLAPNGWSAVRLAQKDKAKLAAGGHAVAAVGRQLLALDRLAGGEPAKLGTAPGEILLVGAGASAGTGANASAPIVLATDRGLFRLDKGKLSPLSPPPPRRARALVGAAWALVDGGAVDLRTGKLTSWPAGTDLEATALGPDDRLIAVARTAGTLELWSLRAGKLDRAPIDIPPAPAAAATPAPAAAATPAPAAATAPAVGVAVDRAGRAVVALRDGRLAVRDGATWTTVLVGEELPTPRPGPPPAASR